jgi:CheY-like chemotaxis protein
MTPEIGKSDPRETSPTRATGLNAGLNTAERPIIVEPAGGQIDRKSEPGPGAPFKTYFPKVEQPLDLAARPVPSGPLPRGTEVILVAEDEPSVRHLARKILETHGYTVLSAANGQDGLHVVREHSGPPIRLVVTDVIMPVMGGKIMVEWLKIGQPDLKVLYTSGYTDEAITDQGVFDAGIAFLPKPYTPATLVRKVRELLDKGRVPAPQAIKQP